MSDLVLSWEDVEKALDILTDKLPPARPYTTVIGVSRGGVLPAALIARQISGKRDLSLRIITAKSYTHRKQNKVQVIIPPDVAEISRCLVIDDIADTGETMKAIVRAGRAKSWYKTSRWQYAALYAKPKGKPFVDHYAISVEQDTWVVFPWERRKK